MTRSRRPIVPRSSGDPLGVRRQVAAAESAFDNRFGEISRLAFDLYFPVLEDSAIRVRVMNRAYEFMLDPDRLKALSAELRAMIERILLAGGEDDLWLIREYIMPAYQAGTAQQWANLAAQSAIYAAARPSLVDLIRTPIYQRRIGYLHARVFEDMRGMTADVAKSVSRILSDGMAQGQHPRELAQAIADAMSDQKYRGYRIARTEIGNAMRQARMDEADNAAREFGIRSKEMHVSAFSPTTRPTHAERSGKLFTREEQREWWSRDANAISCKCVTVSVLVDDDGKPLAPSIVEKANAVKEKMYKKYPHLKDD